MHKLSIGDTVTFTDCKVFKRDWEKDFIEPAQKEHAKTKDKKK